jgi:hypothetical protein
LACADLAQVNHSQVKHSQVKYGQIKYGQIKYGQIGLAENGLGNLVDLRSPAGIPAPPASPPRPDERATRMNGRPG